MIVGHDEPNGCRESSGLDSRVMSNPETAAAQRSNPMTGLDLESFLLLLRADLTIGVVLGLATVGLTVLVWSSWRSRRALSNCLMLSLAAHLGLVLFGSTIPAVMWTLGPDRRDASDRSHIRQIRVAPLVETNASMGGPQLSDSGQVRSRTERWDLRAEPLKLANTSLRVARPHVDNPSRQILEAEITLAPLPPVASASPKVREHVAAPLQARPESVAKDNSDPPKNPVPLPPGPAEMDQLDSKAPIAAAGVAKAREASDGESALSRDSALASDRRLRPDRNRSEAPNPAGVRFTVDANSTAGGRSTPNGGTNAVVTAEKAQGEKVVTPSDGRAGAGEPIPLARATPNSRAGPIGGPRLAVLGERMGAQNPPEIPKMYHPRLEPDRSTRAQRIGASAASELAVERALDWLSRHQDDDGRWDAGIARYEDGTPVKGDDDFTAHCPPGEKCLGECAYWEADTALTGLALLTFLGAGYTHADGRYATVVGKGLDFLVAQQKRDGDLRGRSQVVGMYCHAMATLAMCEAFALTGDDHLRDPVERAIAFLVRGRARDGMAWRYAPGAPVGDTSILGWVVMGLKSAKEVGIPIPGEPAVRRGTLLWLEKVATGQSKGLARYQPWESVTPTMTAEAWVCRQFLGVGGPGSASSEAAEFLLRNESDRGKTNVYYWYYATLALYQHGGEPWTKWNAQIRDKIVGLQAISGHQTGSWEPDSSVYGAKGGRIYCTTLAALSLEVYYRYLRLYDEPKIPLEAGATPERRSEERPTAVPKITTSDGEDR
jgi:hypothetical protein